MSEPTVNVPLLRKAVEWAEGEAAKPWELSEWYQGWFVTPADEVAGFAKSAATKSPECGTCYCIAGFVAVEVLGENLPRAIGAFGIAERALGLSTTQAFDLFAGENTIEDVRRIAESIAGERL